MVDKKKILIVDDEQDYADVLKERLVFEGFETEVAYEGVSGLALFDRFCPDLILLDIMMPGMDGFEFVRELRTRKQGERVPIVFVTAYGRAPSDNERAVIGSSPVIRKPFEAVDLLDVVAKLVS